MVSVPPDFNRSGIIKAISPRHTFIQFKVFSESRDTVRRLRMELSRHPNTTATVSCKNTEEVMASIFVILKNELYNHSQFKVIPDREGFLIKIGNGIL